MAPSSARSGSPVLWVAVHTMEGITDADDAAAYFHRSTNSSAHAVADDQKLIEGIVPYDRAAWTLRGGNPISDNLELCAFADMNRNQWLSRANVTFYAPSLKRTVTARRPYYQLVHAANWIRSRCQARGIAMIKIGPADVAANRRGVIGHTDYTKGKLDGSHWDPGPGFPWDVVMALVTGAVPGQEDAMPLDSEDLRKITQDTRVQVIGPDGQFVPGYFVSTGEMDAQTNRAAWLAANRAAEVKALLQAQTAQITDGQAAVMAAISEDKTQIELTPDQVAQFIAGVSANTKQAFKDALREGTD